MAAVNTSTDDFATAPNTPLAPAERQAFLEPPRASYLDSDATTQRESFIQSTPNNSSPLLPQAEKTENSEYAHGGGAEPSIGAVPYAYEPKRRSHRWRWFLLAAVAIVVVVLAVILPVYFTVIKPRRHTTVASGVPGVTSPIGSGSGNPGSPSGATSGGDGSTIVTANGTKFTYVNKFGGFWVDDPNDPFNNNARPNSWTPPLNTSWTFGQDRIFGVNLGGLFVLEPFIAPALFQKYPGAVDEWTLSTLMAADTASGGLNQLEDHYNTFITEEDIAQIAGAGLNWIRLPIPYWAIETWPGEPFLAKTSWKYILRVLGWARKYGLRVNLDLHTIPGSQNGYNHSGKLGQVNFLYGVMGVANAQRALNYIRIITEFISQPEWKDVVPIFGIVNEALLQQIGRDQLTSFYLEAHDMIRNITGLGAGNGPYISIHDGFVGTGSWANFLSGSDRVILDTHPYFAFDNQPNDDPIATGTGPDAGGVWPAKACQAWGPGVNTSQSAFGVTIAGEFSNGYNDCGLFLKGVPGSTTYGGDCSVWTDASTWNDTIKAGVLEFALASMDATHDFFFWTWKIGNSATSGTVEAPLWSYQLGLQAGVIPADPRMSIGKCSSLGVDGPLFDGTYQPWQTGGVGAGTIAPSSVAQFVWPPATITSGGVPAALPSYTPTGTIATLPPPSLTATTQSVSVGNGWADASDTAGAYTAIASCTYPNAWDAITVPVPPLCGTGVVAVPTPTPTLVPTLTPTDSGLVPPGATSTSTTVPLAPAPTGTSTRTRTGVSRSSTGVGLPTAPPVIPRWGR